MSDIGIRIGAAGNQAALVLEGAWRAVADGKVSQEAISDLYGFLTAEFVNHMNTLEGVANVVEAFPGTTAATPAEAASFQQAAPEHQQAPQAFQPQQPGPFGGAQQTASGYAPHQAPAAQTPPQGQNFQTAPVPGGGSGHKDDAKWQALFANPSGYYDNRQDKRSPSGPDFKHKQSGDALWLQGKYGPAPQWVFDRLQGGFGPVQ